MTFWCLNRGTRRHKGWINTASGTFQGRVEEMSRHLHILQRQIFKQFFVEALPYQRHQFTGNDRPWNENTVSVRATKRNCLKKIRSTDGKQYRIQDVNSNWFSEKAYFASIIYDVLRAFSLVAICRWIHTTRTLMILSSTPRVADHQKKQSSIKFVSR